MPGFDRTGPQGAGPRTGRGMGYCNSYSQTPVFRGGLGLGRGGAGRGWRRRFYTTGIPGWVPPTPEQETADLKAQANWLKEQLDAIQKRIEELTTK
jgi:hypothetical protein